MRIDLHCHTKKIKQGDPYTREVEPEVFAKKILDADVKIVAITNHNAFDIAQYQILREKVKDYCDVWPGIELDAYGDQRLKDKEIKFHLIVVGNPNEAVMFKETIDKLLKGFDIENGSKHINEICDAFVNADVLFIPHYMGKKPAISDGDLELLKNKVGDSTKVFTETTESSIGVLVNNDFHALVGSDVRDWNIYEESMFSDLRLPVSSFEQFCLLAKRDTVVINTILNQKNPKEFSVSPNKNISFKLKIFEDVNVIFGQKGTGKTEILNSLHNSMQQEGYTCVKYIGSQKEDDFNRLLNTTDMKVDCEYLEVDKCEEEFNSLINWKDSNITLFANYIKWLETRSNNNNKKSMKITEAVEISLPNNSDLSESKKDRDLLMDAQKKLCQINLDNYFTKKEKSTMECLLNELSKKINYRVLSSYDEYKAIELVNYSINKIKELADKKTDTVSKPSSTGFLDFAHTHLALKKIIKKILKQFKVGSKYMDYKIGELEGKGNVYVRSMYRMLCEDSKTNEFKKGIQTLKAIKKSFEEIEKKYYSSDISSNIGKVVEVLNEKGISNIEVFIGISKKTIDSNGLEYFPSNGEKGILLLQDVIKEVADAYFFDEPELGMGNSYIDATIRPQISDLARRQKVVFIATHNANLAVRTLPYMSIFRKHENGNYYTYTGNPFRNELINIDDKADSLNWTEESMHTLEGGKEAFYERKDIYESGSN